MSEIDSFTSKFKALLANGFEATLTLETIDGEAYVTLKAGLGRPTVASTLDPTQNLLKRPRSPAYYRRQERRRLDRRQAMKAEAADVEVAPSTIITKNSIDATKMEEVKAEEAVKNLESIENRKPVVDFSSGSETFIYNHWSKEAVCIADAVKLIRERLVQSFVENKIDNADQKFEICAAECTDTENNEIEVKVKVPKDIGRLKQAMRKICTRYVPGDEFEISFKGSSS